MEPNEPTESAEIPQDAIIVKADEVDDDGADISTVSPTDNADWETLMSVYASAPYDDPVWTQRAQEAQTEVNSGQPSLRKSPVRPILRREASAPVPPQQPPPPAPPHQQEDPGNPTDSLSLMQLRNLVTNLPRVEPTAYAYEYEDTRSFPEELEEWFQYTEDERFMLLRAKQAFEGKWEQSNAVSDGVSDKIVRWTEVEPKDRKRFIHEALHDLADQDVPTRIKSLECISYIALGVWADTAGLSADNGIPERSETEDRNFRDDYNNSGLQLEWIRKGIKLLCEAGAVQKIFDLLREVEKNELQNELTLERSSSEDDESRSSDHVRQIVIHNTLTMMYLIVEVGRWQVANDNESTIRQTIADIEPHFLLFLTKSIAKLRWEDSTSLPLPRVLLLFWKSILLLFGSTTDVQESKDVLREVSDPKNDDRGEGFITATPLDYHLFRQEITSKYPAYSPPAPLVPLELENNSILPPLPNHPSRKASQEGLHIAAGVGFNGSGGSIFNQPVHIATPAPSPPPSPAGPGGKGGKKQNYQTNQNFPFLYPPLDNSSNTIGGKGEAELQDKLVGKKWEGSDVPASILEAGQLFASRMRMSRSIRQLWDVRQKYIKFERGWDGTEKHGHTSNGVSEEDDAEAFTDSEDERPETVEEFEEEHLDIKETENIEVQRRLDAIEHFYRNTLPHLQSLVIVLWKVTFANVSALVAQLSGANGPQGTNGFAFPEEGTEAAQAKRKVNQNMASHSNGAENAPPIVPEDGVDPEIEELNAVRSREITSKAISGVLLLLLKWFKVSHILKYEYMTQLLLDSNYLPLILKLFAHQDIDRAVVQKNDRKDLDFFHFCQLNSAHPPKPPPQLPVSTSPSSEDEAQPPPILKKHRRSPTSQSPPPSPEKHPEPPSPPPRPEVDELGYPTTAPPPSPLTTYSPRFFFTTITYLRLLQKITKRKAHRALLLVQYKSSTIFRKALKIPQPTMRLYTLKLFKSQVPYCGRKWRQTNMRVITAVYLHCKPELRDEWLCGGDVDGVVEEAVPLEQAGRSLVHWWHLRGYRDVMEGGESGREISGNGGGGEGTDVDFFARELERMGWGVEVGFANDEADEVGGREREEGGHQRSEWEGGPLALEGWN